MGDRAMARGQGTPITLSSRRHLMEYGSSYGLARSKALGGTYWRYQEERMISRGAGGAGSRVGNTRCFARLVAVRRRKKVRLT